MSYGVYYKIHFISNLTSENRILCGGGLEHVLLNCIFSVAGVLICSGIQQNKVLYHAFSVHYK